MKIPEPEQVNGKWVAYQAELKDLQDDAAKLVFRVATEDGLDSTVAIPQMLSILRKARQLGHRAEWRE